MISAIFLLFIYLTFGSYLPKCLVLEFGFSYLNKFCGNEDNAIGRTDRNSFSGKKKKKLIKNIHVPFDMFRCLRGLAQNQ